MAITPKRHRPRTLHHEPGAVTWAREKCGLTKRALAEAPVVREWLVAHPRFALHFTPTYSSWINQVERWFAELQRRCLERGVFCSVDALQAALEKWIEVWNEQARPFRWTKTADQIIDRICRYCDRISGPDHLAPNGSSARPSRGQALPGTKQGPPWRTAPGR